MSSFPDGTPWDGFWPRWTPAYVAEMNAFVELALGRRESPCTVEDALEAFYVAEAATRSRLEHRPVTLVEARADVTATFDVVTVGRICVDVYPQQTGVGLAEVETFGKYLGGTATNVAVAAARYGRTAAVVTGTGDDPFGRWIRTALTGFGVDDRWVATVPGLLTQVTFCEVFPPDDFPLYFYGRTPTAADLQIRPEDLDLDAVRSAGVLWVTGTGMCQEPSRQTHLVALEARGRAAHTVVDLDYRPMFWPSRADGPSRDLPAAPARHGGRRQPRRVRDRGRRGRPAARGASAAGPRRRPCRRQAGPAGGAGRDGDRDGRGAAGPHRGGQRPGRR